MRAIDGKLSIGQRYKYVSCKYAGKYVDETDFDFCQCDNCGKMISNVAEVVGEMDERHYHIGLDCAATLTGIEPMQIRQAQKEMRKAAKFAKWLATACTNAYVGKNLIWLYDKPSNTKGEGFERWDSRWAWRIPIERIDEIKKFPIIKIVFESNQNHN